MQRRSVLMSVVIGIVMGLLLPSLAGSAGFAAAGSDGHRSFVLTQTHNLAAPEGSAGVTNLWVPLPEDFGFQRVRKISFDGNYKDAYITTANEYGARTLFATWPDAKNKPQLTVTLEIDTFDWEPELGGLLAGYRVPETISYPKEIELYLQPTTHIAIDGIVRTTADKIVGGETNPLKKARLI